MLIELIEDNIRLAKNIQKSFESKGNNMLLYHSRSSFLHESGFLADVYIIDVNLKDGNGLDILQYIRSIKQIHAPVIIISGYSGIKAKLESFEMGADDYIVKPFASKELHARIRSILRRSGSSDNLIQDTGILKYKGICFYKQTRQTFNKQGELIQLSRKEKCLLEYFLEHIGTLIPKDTLKNHVWGDSIKGNVSDNTLNVTLHKMRHKLGDTFQLETIIGEGYLLT